MVLGCLGCETKSVKVAYAFNLIVFLIGAAALFFAVLAYFVINPISVFVQHGFEEIKLILCGLMIAGVFFMLLASLAVCGARRQNVCMLRLYISLVFILINLQAWTIFFAVPDGFTGALEEEFQKMEWNAKAEGLCEMFQDFANQSFCCPDYIDTMYANDCNLTCTTSSSTDSANKLPSCVSKIEEPLHWSNYHTVASVVLFLVEVLAIRFVYRFCTTMPAYQEEQRQAWLASIPVVRVVPDVLNVPVPDVPIS